MKKGLSTKDKAHLFDGAFENSAVGMAIVDLDGKWLKVNKALCNITGYSAEELMKLDFQSITHPDDLIIDLAYNQQLLEGEIPSFQMEKRYIHKLGSPVWINLCVSAVRDNEGNIIYTISHVQDITINKIMEETLWENHQTIDALIKSSPLAIICIDKTARVKIWNPAAENLFGWKEEDVFNKLTPFLVDEDIHDFITEIQTGKPVTGRELVKERQNGNRVYISLSSAPLRNSKGETTGAIGIFEDITERKKTEEMLLKSEKLSVVAELAAGIAHEVRNPLTTLKGFTQILRSRDNGELEILDTMASEIDRINLIVSELMLLTKAKEVNFEKRNINDILNSVISLLGNQALLCNIDIVTRSSPNLPKIYCDELSIKKVLVNIIENAMEAMNDGGAITITLGRLEENKVRIRIIDEGSGISKENLKKLGEPFFTTKEKGTGLGLTVCQRIIRAHQGTFEINSKEGIETVVEIILPINSSWEFI